MELYDLRLQYQQSPRKFTKSKKLNNYRNLERKNFSTKNYDGASYFKYLADELENFERVAEEEKHLVKFERQENLIKKKQEGFMNNFLKRIQRDRDE